MEDLELKKNLELGDNETDEMPADVPADSSIQMEIPVPDQSKNMKKWLFTKMGILNEDFNFIKSIPSANDSYLMSVYGHAYSSKERIDNFLKDLSTAITTKNGKGEYACVKALPEDLAEYKDAILKIFRDKGYTAENLKERITGVTINYIFVCWDKFDSSKSV